MYRYSPSPGDSRSPGAKVEDGCEPLNVSNRNKTGPLQELQEF